MKISHCKINHMTNPIGYQLKQIVCSWITDCKSVQASRIIVRLNEEIAEDTGWSKLNPLATKLKVKLKPRTRYTWTVSVKDMDGKIATGEEQFFETGKMDEPWIGNWITAKDDNERHPIFCRKIEMDSEKEIRNARLYVCGLGLYEAYVNGEKVGDALLTPGFYAYNLWNQAQTYDITKYLPKKKTKDISCDLEVLMGDGWYKSRISFESPKAAFYGKDYRLIAEIHITYADGSTQIIGTDEKWKVKRSCITFSGIYDGEYQDYTLTDNDMEEVFISMVHKEKLEDNLSIPVKTHEKFHPVFVENEAREVLLDVGQNLAGIFCMKVNIPYGKKVHLQFGEVLQDGRFYRENLRTAKAEFWYVSDGRERIIRPHFTYYGFRYIKIEGVEDFRTEDIEVFAIYSDIFMRGSIITGNQKLNQLISNVVWGMKSNFVDIPTDCPQRDERMGWTGDTQVFSETAGFLGEIYPFYRKYLYDMAMEQSVRNGAVPDIIPAVGMGDSCSSVWGDAAVILPWNMYVASGDISILEEQYASMKAWVEYIRKLDNGKHHWREHFHYGDWLALDCPYEGRQQTRGGTDEGFIAEVYYRKSTLILSETARILGYDQDAAEYQALADEIYQEIRNEYYSPNGRCCVYTQTAALLSINEKLCDTARSKKQLLTLLENSENKLKTGFVGTPLLCQVLAEIGCEQLADRILLNEEYPGWLFAVNQGATTIWERWDSLDENGHISGTGMNSLNHYAYGAVAAYIWKSLAGLRLCPEVPGYKKVMIKPHVNPKLGYLKAVFLSPAGEYEIFWEIVDRHHIHLEIIVPAGCEAEIILPLDKEKRSVILLGDSLNISYETEKEIGTARSIDDTLQVLMGNVECKQILIQELPDLEYLLGFTRAYPLNETLRNLRYETEHIDRIAEKLAKIME